MVSSEHATGWRNGEDASEYIASGWLLTIVLSVEKGRTSSRETCGLRNQRISCSGVWAETQATTNQGSACAHQRA